MPSYAVTGTSGGIGLGFIKALSVDSNNVVFALTRSKSGAKDLLEFASSAPNKNVHVLEAQGDNVKSLEDAAAAISKITGGTLDVLINNAAMMVHERSFLTLDAFPSPEVLDEDLTAFFKANVVGVIHTINAFTPLLKAGPTKKCIVISTPVGSPKVTVKAGFAMFAGYGISKAALNVATTKFAVRYKDEGILFVMLNPGFVRTLKGSKEEVDGFYNRQEAAMREKYPGHEGAITVEESVRDQLALISRLTMKDTGAFYSRDGTEVDDAP